MLTPKYMFEVLTCPCYSHLLHSEDGGIDRLSSSAEDVTVTRWEAIQHKQSLNSTAMRTY